MSLTTYWEEAQEVIKEKVGTISYETWFSTIQVTEKTPDTLLVEAPDDFFKGWIVEHYEDIIKTSLEKIANKCVNLEFSVNSHLLKEDTQLRLTKMEADFKGQGGTASNLNARFNFDSFVVGPSNRFAAAACLAVAESPAKAYNPLLIYGPVGLGKTHLIQAITHQIQLKHPHLKICYLSSEQFTNELINAIRNRSTDQYRKKFRAMDVLLVDDIQFIAGKESTQEEFFHTFNYLHDHRKQIILTSDRPPKEIAKLEERLSSRFAWGLITDIQAPNFETRVAILRKKLENETMAVPDDVVNFIAEEITTNIRELEGALIRVSAYALLEERSITLELAQIILRDMVNEVAKNITIDIIQKEVSKYFQIPLTRPDQSE